MTTIEERAAAVVADMIEMGAIFEIADSGPTGEARWHWRPESEPMRGVIRRLWTATPDRNAPGFNAAMVAAIREHQRGGAHAH